MTSNLWTSQYLSVITRSTTPETETWKSIFFCDQITVNIRHQIYLNSPRILLLLFSIYEYATKNLKLIFSFQLITFRYLGKIQISHKMDLFGDYGFFSWPKGPSSICLVCHWLTDSFRQKMQILMMGSWNWKVKVYA